MNRRQDIVVYVTGALLAMISAYNGDQDGEWLFAAFVPVLIVGTLVAHAFRTKTTEIADPASVLKKGLGLTLAVVFGAHLLTHLGR